MITEMNIAIAEFCGHSVVSAGTKTMGQIKPPEISEALLWYDSNWNCLMPVWFKIQQAGADEGYAFKKYHEAFHAGIDHQSIEKCYKAVYEAVLWLNSKNKS